MKIGQRIIEDGLHNTVYTKKRETVRAVIMNEEKNVLMVYSHLFNDYTFPGGGIKAHETHEGALKRELYKEVGARKINIIESLGETEEIRYGINESNNIYLQTSYYYNVSIIENGDQHLIDREILHGLEPRWIKIEDAINHNQTVIRDEKHQQKGLKTVLIRENILLNMLKENHIHEKI